MSFLSPLFLHFAYKILERKSKSGGDILIDNCTILDVISIEPLLSAKISLIYARHECTAVRYENVGDEILGATSNLVYRLARHLIKRSLNHRFVFHPGGSIY